MSQVVASRYAAALADAVLDPKSQVQAQQALGELISVEQMVNGASELRNILLSPAVPAVKKRAVIARFAEMLPLSSLIRNFFYVLIDHHRIGILDQVRKAFEAALDTRMGVVRAEVSSAAPLSGDQRNALQAQLAGMTGKQVRCEFVVDPALVGGAKARIGSTIYDGSVRAQLDTMRRRLVATR